MHLTHTEELLIDGLKLFGVNGETIIGIMMFLNTEELQNQMIDYLMDNSKATEQDILLEMKRICRG